MNPSIRLPVVDQPPKNPPHPRGAEASAPAVCEDGLSTDARRFLHELHVAERQLNAAFSVARDGGGLEQRISRVYREMFGTD
jgi:hypothetical protein